MMKQIRNLGVVALLTIAIAGCSDSIVDTADSDVIATYDAYDATLLSETLMATYGEVPSVEQALLSDSTDTTMCSGDSMRGGERGGRGPGGRGGKHGPRDHGRDGGIGNIAPLGIKNYRAAASQLDLSAEQDSLFRLYLADLRSCAQDAAATYRTAREAAFAPYKESVDSIRAAVKAGTITHEAARTQLDSIRAAFEASIAPLNETLRAAVASCRSTFESRVEAMLTEAQHTLWLTLM